MTFTRALITGASSGIGRAMAVELAAGGCDLVVVARSEPALEGLRAEVGGSGGVEVEVLVADLTDRDDVDRVADRLRRVDAPIDLLVNNAGMSTTGAFTRHDSDSHEAQVALNVTAPVRLSHAILPGLLERGAGGILTTSSFAGFEPMPQLAVYGATKAFLTSFSQALHEEVRGSGVHVTVLCPGFVRTPFVSEEEVSRIPSQLMMSAEEVAHAGLDAVASNRAMVIPRLTYRVAATAIKAVPGPIWRRAISLGMGGGR